MVDSVLGAQIVGAGCSAIAQIKLSFTATATSRHYSPLLVAFAFFSAAPSPSLSLRVSGEVRVRLPTCSVAVASVLCSVEDEREIKKRS
jgi:type 1 fimbria pilin